MYRSVALATVLFLGGTSAAGDKDWTGKSIKLTESVKLGRKFGGGLIRDGAAVDKSKSYVVKSDDGSYLELVGETGFIFKSEAQLVPQVGAQPDPTRLKVDDPDAVKKELAGLRGTWQCRAGESNGKDDGPDAPKLWVLVFEKDKIVYKENGKVVAEGDLQIDPTKSPKQITARFPALNQTDVMIFVRVGDVLVLCGHRDGKTRPTRFESGTKDGGAFLTAWERVK